MNLLDSRVALRLRPLPDILDLAFRVVCGPNLRPYARLAALGLVPCLAICVALRALFAWRWSSVWLAAWVLSATAQGLFTLAAGQLLFADSISLRRLVGRFLRRLPAYSASLLLSRLAIFAVSMLTASLLLPSAWTRYLFVREISLLEDSGPWPALGRCMRFVRRQGWATFGLLCSILLAEVAFTVVAELFGQALFGFVLQVGRPVGSLFDGGGSFYALCGYFAAVPYVATARFLKYIDIRTRKEGWDVQLKFMAVQASQAAAAEAASPPRAQWA